MTELQMIIITIIIINTFDFAVMSLVMKVF